MNVPSADREPLERMTLHDVAVDAGVSRATASLVVRGSPLVAEETRRRVLAETHDRGRTEQFTPVQLSTPAAPGTILDLRIAGHDGRQLLAR